MTPNWHLFLKSTAAAGFVTWDAHIPNSANWTLHKQTFHDALYTALAFADQYLCARGLIQNLPYENL
jgi:hypothetical protein